MTLPDALVDLLRLPSPCFLATLMPDGAPQMTQTWVDTDGTHVLVNTVDGHQKVRNIERDPRVASTPAAGPKKPPTIERHPRVALNVTDPEAPRRYFEVRGRVVEVTAEGAREHIDELAQRYLGRPYPWFGGRDQVRLLVRIAPERVTSPRG